MKVLLVDPPGVPPTSYKPPYAFGLLSIKAYLNANGYNDIAISNFHRYNKSMILSYIKRFSPDVVGTSCCTDTRGFCIELARAIKDLKTNTKIIFGNVHATFFPVDILKLYPVDIVVIGEGEETTLELIRAIESGAPLKNIKGIAFKENSEIHVTPKRPLISNLDSLPTPSDKRIFINELGNRQAYIMTSRGCPFSCQFCSSVYMWGRTWRSRNPESIIKEIEMLLQQGLEYIDFYDDLFTLNNKRAILICNEIINRGLKFKWFARARVDCISEDLIMAMERAGCVEISFGIESGSPLILKTINKDINLKKAEEVFKIMRKTKMTARANFMLGNPNETKDTIKETAEFIRKINPDDLNLSITLIYPNTELSKIAETKGLVDKDFWIKTAKLAPRYTADFSTKELRGASIKILLYYWLWNRGVFFSLKWLARQLKRSGFVITSSFLRAWISLLFKDVFSNLYHKRKPVKNGACTNKKPSYHE